MNDLVLTAARVVLDDRVIDGTLVARDGAVVAVEPGTTRAPGALDLEGDWLLPGLVELHTDNLERQFQPRPGVRWPAAAAMLQHDTQVAAAGITTVCDAVCVGFYGDKQERIDYLQASLDLLRQGRAAGALKAEHLLHLRLEVTDPHCVELFEPLMTEDGLALVSFMDHTPGQRQWHDIHRYRTFHMGRTVENEGQFQAMLARRIDQQKAHAARNRDTLLRLLDGHPAVRASHDDTTLEHVREARAAGVTISEFPTTVAAARAARDSGMTVVMGAPNLIVGGSHSGNVSAADLAAAGLLDAFSSDYVPASLVQAAFRLARDGWSVPDAVATVTRNPAAMLGRDDRGVLAPGRRADLVRVRVVAGTPQVLAVWREGQRVA
jgi:alpha-D-ribose 1-methylphosphonate 5-triphosphate diphosphatase